MKLREHINITKRAVRQMFQMEKRFTICLILDAFLSSIVVYIPVYYSAKVIDALYEKAALAELIKYVVLTVGLVFLVKLINTFISSMKGVAEDAMYRSENWLYSEAAMKMAYESIEDNEVNRLLHRIRMETQTGYNRFYLYQSLERFISNAVKIVASIAMTFSFFTLPSIPPVMKLALVGGLVLLLLCTLVTNKKVNKLFENFSKDVVDINVRENKFVDYLEDYGSGKDIRLYGMSEYLADEYYKVELEFHNHNTKRSFRQLLLSIPGTILEHGFRLCIYAVLIYAAILGEIGIGSIAKYVTCIMMLLNAITAMIRTLNTAFENNHYMKRYYSYFDIENPMYRGSLTVEKRDDNDYDVEFRDVSFRYPNTESYALRHVSLKFNTGEKLAIVGMNGSGKTTFIKLLCRLYDPCEGKILLNGVDIRKYDYDEYMSIFSVVFQDFHLFSFRLGEVVASGKYYDKERVEESLRKANFGERFGTLPEGTETYLYKAYDKSGIEVSGGEAQKIALARALYKNAPFILLDEPTAALDPVSEYEVYSNFNAIAGDKTTVYISHRLASCRFCEKIAVFDRGEIVQVGTHEDLIKEETQKYYELWHAQAQYYTQA